MVGRLASVSAPGYNPLEIMTQHSPATQAVLDSIKVIDFDWSNMEQADSKLIAAAALRAVVEHCVPDDSEGHWVYIPHILNIVNEIEAL